MIQSIRHLEHQNPSINSGDIGDVRCKIFYGWTDGGGLVGGGQPPQVDI